MYRKYLREIEEKENKVKIYQRKQLKKSLSLSTLNLQQFDDEINFPETNGIIGDAHRKAARIKLGANISNSVDDNLNKENLHEKTFDPGGKSPPQKRKLFGSRSAIPVSNHSGQLPNGRAHSSVNDTFKTQPKGTNDALSNGLANADEFIISRPIWDNLTTSLDNSLNSSAWKNTTGLSNNEIINVLPINDDVVSLTPSATVSPTEGGPLNQSTVPRRQLRHRKSRLFMWPSTDNDIACLSFNPLCCGLLQNQMSSQD